MRVLQRSFGERDECLVERLVECVVLVAQLAPLRQPRAMRVGGNGEDGRQIQSLALPVRDTLRGVERLCVTDRLIDTAEAQFGEVARGRPRR